MCRQRAILHSYHSSIVPLQAMGKGPSNNSLHHCGGTRTAHNSITTTPHNIVKGLLNDRVLIE